MGWALVARARAVPTQLLLAMTALATVSCTADAVYQYGYKQLHFPAGRFPHLGGLHLLSAFQCLVHPAPNGSFFATLDHTHFSRGIATCAAPVVDVGEVQGVLAAEEEAKKRREEEQRRGKVVGGGESANGTLQTSVAAGVKRKQAKEESLAWKIRLLATQYTNTTGAYAEDSGFSSLKWGAHLATGDLTRVLGKRPTDLHEYGEQLARLLTLHRNSDLGDVWRYSGKYEILAVSSVRRAVCLTPSCTDVTAVDTTGRGACAATGCSEPYDPSSLAGRLLNEDAVTVVTHTEPAEDAVPTSVSVMQTGFLGLGRAVRVQKRWLNDTDAWDLTAAIQTQLYTPSSRFPEFKGERMLRSVWPLGDGAAADEALGEQGYNSSEWLQKVAISLCHEPVPVYMRGRLCKGIKPRKRHAVGVTYNGERDVEVDDPSTPDRQTGVIWRVVPARQEVGAARSCSFHPDHKGLDRASTQSVEPTWMAGTASREINAASPDELSLARRLSRCTIKLGVPSAVGFLRGREDLSRREDVTRVTRSLRAGGFGDMDLPPEPFSNSEFVEVLVVIALAAFGVLASVPDYNNGHVRWWEGVRHAVIAIAGIGAFIPLGLMTYREWKGANWHAATTRVGLHVAFSPSTAGCRGLPYECKTRGHGLRGSSLLISETLVIASTNHYRFAHLVVACGVAAFAYYCILVGPLELHRFYQGQTVALQGDENGSSTPKILSGSGSGHGALALEMPDEGVAAPPPPPSGWDRGWQATATPLPLSVSALTRAGARGVNSLVRSVSTPLRGRPSPAPVPSSSGWPAGWPTKGQAEEPSTPFLEKE